MIESSLIEKKLMQCQVPYLNKNLLESQWIHKLTVEKQCLTLELRTPFPLTTAAQTALRDTLKVLLPEFDVALLITTDIPIYRCQPHVQLLSGVKNIIAISSGKGGVGKSTTAVNLALALKHLGARVGLLDADIYGPNQPHLLGIQQKPDIIDERFMKPIERFGLQTISFGNLIAADTPAVWRGPMVAKALQQLVFQTQWDQLDYLLIDMPPGTGDVQLTLAKSVPVSGVVVVTTPQDMALIDARKGLEMFHKVQVSLLGIIENMSMFQCPHCGEKTAVFGTQGGETLAQDTNVPLLGKIPLVLDIRRDADQGVPTVEASSDGPIAQLYQDIALTMLARLSLMPVVPFVGKEH